MSRHNIPGISFSLDLLAILGLSLLLIVTIFFLRVPALRILLGGPFVLFFPGYTLAAALFPRNDSLEGIERLGLSLGLSIAVLPLMGLVLNYTPWGITLLTTLFSATLFIVVACAVAHYRRSRLAPEQRYAVRLELDLTGWRSGGLVDRSLTFALAMSVVAAVGTFLFVIAKPEVGETFTEFYVLGPYGEADAYPERVLQGELLNPIVGVVNREHTDMDYQIRIEAGGQEVVHITDIKLAHDEKWVKRVVFALTEPGEEQKLQFLLYREGQEEPYRSLHLWIDVVAVPTPQAIPTPGAPEAPTPEPSTTVVVSPTAAVVETATPSPSSTPTPTEAPSVSPVPTQTPGAQVIHVVQPGENLSSIARQYGVTYQDIMEANGLDDPNLIRVGQELEIPVQ